MSVNKNSTYVSHRTQPIIQSITNGYFQANVLHRLQWFAGWLAHRRKKESQSRVDVNYELENERFTENGYFHISEEQARLERMIELSWFNLRMKKNL